MVFRGVQGGKYVINLVSTAKIKPDLHIIDFIHMILKI